MTITTVTGDIPVAELGFTSMHEHVLVDLSAYERVHPALVGESDGSRPVTACRRNPLAMRGNLALDDDIAAIEALARLRDAGGRTIVDATCTGIRNRPRALARIARRSGVNIVACTGIYIEPSWPAEYLEATSAQLQSHFESEIEHGIADTGLRAGHIGEIGLTGPTERETRAFRAALRAARNTGCSVTVHPGPWTPKKVDAILEIIASENLPPDRVIIGHVDGSFTTGELARLVADSRNRSVQLHTAVALLDAGVNIALDCFGTDYDIEPLDMVLTKDWERLSGLVALLRQGYARQIVLGCDVFAQMHLPVNGGNGYGRIAEWVVPRLRACAVDEHAIQQLTHENPGRLLSRN